MNETLKRARDLDAQDRLLDATAAYENALEEGPLGSEELLDMAVAYLSMHDGGRQELKSDHEFVRTWDRGFELLDRVEREGRLRSEARFWKLYFRWLILDEPLDREAVLNVVDVTESLVPCFFLWLDSRGTEFVDQARQLSLDCADATTARKRWIRSLLLSKAIDRHF